MLFIVLPVYRRKPDRIKAHVFVCVLSLLLLVIIEKRLTESHLTIERTAEILREIKAIPVKSPMNMVYRSESGEAAGILNEMGNHRIGYWLVHYQNPVRNIQELRNCLVLCGVSLCVFCETQFLGLLICHSSPSWS